ncbi:MAG TPA: TIM-barrel domain-containing protein [Mucilaginibacter sp.]|nr:TIM-barrel domain-containing protein [Mucilaginibacter sp.]
MIRKFTFQIIVLSLCLTTAAKAQQIKEMAPGVTRVTVGEVDRFSPYNLLQEKPKTEAMSKLPEPGVGVDPKAIRVEVNARGAVVHIPLGNKEEIYGFGLQMGSFRQRGLKRRPIVNDNPLNDLGFTHAPTTFYVSNKGYGIFINTSRYTTFYCGTHKQVKGDMNENTGAGNAAQSVEDLYKNTNNKSGEVIVDIPGAKGGDVFIFNGPTLKNALQRYNLFSGGGAMPAMWGLGLQYRMKGDSKQEDVYKMAAYFRDNHMPVDVFGLEPKWQTAAYSCSYVWSPDNFPAPQELIDRLKGQGIKLNLWEHAYTSPVSPIYGALASASGDYKVWNGLVPDFAGTVAPKIFADYHKKTFVDNGVASFKLDECDNSNLTRGSAVWAFPELSQFPSGIDGEQMHQQFGTLYFQTMYNIYKQANKRSYFSIRSLNGFASSFPTTLYSDTYVHSEYIRMISNAGFSGLLWSPEVRESANVKELCRRAQTSILAAETVFDSWYLKSPPWLQFNRDKNNKGEMLPNAKEVESHIRTLLNFRMSFIPYLYSAFAKYNKEGVPPFRALVVDYPEDKATYDVWDEYMIGDNVLAAPLADSASSRKVYLPKGNWYDYNTNKVYTGGQSYTVETGLDQIPIFIKEGAILPLAKPVEHVEPDTKFEITCYVYGPNAFSAGLFEDDGVTFDFEKGKYNIVNLDWRDGKGKVKRSGDLKSQRYLIKKWVKI